MPSKLSLPILLLHLPYLLLSTHRFKYVVRITSEQMNIWKIKKTLCSNNIISTSKIIYKFLISIKRWQQKLVRLIMDDNISLKEIPEMSISLWDNLYARGVFSMIISRITVTFGIYLFIYIEVPSRNSNFLRRQNCMNWFQMSHRCRFFFHTFLSLFRH